MTYAAVTQSSTVDTSYNGWNNYETWLVNLWLTNDESSYYQLAQILALYSDVVSQGDAIEEWVRADQAITTGLYADLINAALGKVSWYEIAENNQ